MRYNKQIENGYIVAIGTGSGGVQISKNEFDYLSKLIKEKPTPKEGYGFRLKVNRTWEEYELPPVEENDEISNAEALSIILGGSI